MPGTPAPTLSTCSPPPLPPLAQFHPEVLRGCLHEFVKAAVPALDTLRSFTAKNAMLLFFEMFGALGKALDKEVDDIVPTLLKKAGEISNAGWVPLFF